MDEVRTVRSIDEILSGKVVRLGSGSRTCSKDVSELGIRCVDANNSILDWINLENQSDSVPETVNLHIVSSFIDDGEGGGDDDGIAAPLSNCKIDNDVINDAEERVTVILRLRNCDHYEVTAAEIRYTWS
jgi:hypothetical protein